MPDDRTAALVERFRAGDEKAADELFRRFAKRLAGLAARFLSEKLRRRVDPEDVVQSAYRSFFMGARRDRFSLKQSGDLWRLLVSITLNKLRNQADRHNAAKRAVAQDHSPGSGDSSLDMNCLALAREPSPLEAVALADELEQVLHQLPSRQRPMVELRLQGYNFEEIAEKLQCSERSVRRVLENLKQLLKEGKTPKKTHDP